MHRMRKMNITCCVAAFFVVTSAARADVFHMGAGLTSVEFVTVGNPGNAPDTRYKGISVGSVDHVYQIGKYEITAGQYTDFLNAVAKDDPNGLYDQKMSEFYEHEWGANILQSGSSPNFTYSVASDWANRPVNYVSYWDAVRFCNWLHNGQPSGPQGPGTTEGGAYHDVGNEPLYGRNLGARFFVPTEDEWYKAAYHNKSAGLAATYFDCPTGSNTPPVNTLPDSGNHANFFDTLGTGNFNYTIGRLYYRTEVGAFANSASPYGTFDQGGNVEEWNEMASGISLGSLVILRGGSFLDGSEGQQASLRFEEGAIPFGFAAAGFRIAAAVPEPSTLVLGSLTSLGVLVMLVRRRRLTAP
jgi:formylglycine-generating enzyme required for sulfatase activity